MDANNASEANNGYTNPAYIGSTTSIPGEYRAAADANKSKNNNNVKNNTHKANNTATSATPSAAESAPKPGRDNWNNDIEFLFSCIAMSVGLGNVWRFPFTALENGGGAFLIPYLVVLFLVGKPVYYMEMLLGQFSSRGSVKVYDFAPILRGVGYGQVMATGVVTTYYATLMAITLRYLIDSFFATLPWSYCREEWGSNCIASKLKSDELITNITSVSDTIKTTSAEFYFTSHILHEKEGIDDGLGIPSWNLAITLAVSWLVIALIVIRGVKSSGKASYVLAIFPYVVLLILLIRALTLPGAFDGVLYFLKPQWDKLLEPKVWYAAVTQVFFSLGVCFGGIIMYASYNRFGHNIYRDCTIVTTLDTFTSLLSGIAIFGILGNLAYENNTDDIQSVVKGGTGLAFISYPDAIAKFSFLPQLFAVLFFIMLFVLGIGSNVGMASCIITVLKDQFSNTKHWIIVVCIAICGYLLGLMYITPGGQYILNFLDFYGSSFVALVLAIFELIAVGWIYGVKRLCSDVHFMLGIKTSLYYRICWGIITPVVMTAILIYKLVEYEPLDYNGYTYQSGLYVFGWCLSAFGIGQLLIWGIYAVSKQSSGNLWTRIARALRPTSQWGPLEPKTLKDYQLYIQDANTTALFKKTGFWHSFYDNIFG